MKSLPKMAVRALRWKPMVIAAATLLPVACILFLFSGGAQGKADSGNISVSLEPRQIQLGEGAILRVQVSGDDAGQPVVAEVPGLRFFPVGQSSEYQSINGRVSSSTSYLFQVQAEHPGQFTIPPIEVRINGRVRKTQSMSTQGGRRRQPESPLSNPAAPCRYWDREEEGLYRPLIAPTPEKKTPLHF